MNFEVLRDDLHTTRVVHDDPALLVDGQARLRVRRFGFSANNITYAVFGEMMRYWTFFPTDDPAWGRVPVWGFAEVVEANGTGLTDGELIYGYLPMGTELIVTPTRVNDGGFVDDSTHRSTLPSAYNSYTRCAADTVYDPATEAEQMLLRPLFMTDFVLDDWLADEGWFGGDVVLISSASAKTAFGLAYLVAQRANHPTVVGLTSPANVAFVEQLGCYDRVLTYDDVEQLDEAAPSVYVDIAGDAAVRRAVHTHLAGLTASVQVGGTHWTEVGGDAGLPGPSPALFFAPDQIVKRRRDWGAGGIESRFATAWASLLAWIADWLSVVERSGPDGVEQTYLEMLDGTADPSKAFVLSLD